MAEVETALLKVLVRPACSATGKGWSGYSQAAASKGWPNRVFPSHEQQISGSGIHGTVVNPREKLPVLVIQGAGIQACSGRVAETKVQEVTAIG